MRIGKILCWSAVAVGLLALGGYVVWNSLCCKQFDGETTRIYIPAGSTADAVTDSLESRLGDFGSKVADLWKLQKGTPERAHGSYLVEPGTDAITLSRRIRGGQQSPIRFTFNNIRTPGDFYRRAAAVFEADSAQFAAAADSILPAKGYIPATYAAAILPDSYEFYWTSSPERVLTTLENHRDEFWTAERREKAQQLGLSPEQVATLASIVEEETNKADERPMVAALYLNRLRRNMNLQADPTVKFAIGDFTLQRITAAHLSVESPYNTYKNAGLPPGPIRIVEGRSIDAVLNAPEHNYLYMCAKPDFSGYHDFAETYDRHRINAARYHRALSARGIN